MERIKKNREDKRDRLRDLDTIRGACSEEFIFLEDWEIVEVEKEIRQYLDSLDDESIQEYLDEYSKHEEYESNLISEIVENHREFEKNEGNVVIL